MITESAKQIFEIEVAELETWGKRPHKHNFFEIVFVDSGSGTQCINQHEFAYQEGNVFLLPPLVIAGEFPRRVKLQTIYDNSLSLFVSLDQILPLCVRLTLCYKKRRMLPHPQWTNWTWTT